LLFGAGFRDKIAPARMALVMMIPCANGLYFGIGFGGVAIGLGRGIFRAHTGEVVIAYKFIPPAVGGIVDVFFHGCFLLLLVFEVEVIKIQLFTLVAVGSGGVWRVRDR
jgi:hypothetical protein